MKKSYLYKFLSAGFIALSLQSCFVAKDYERPEILEVDNYRNNLASGETTNLAELSWQELFTDPVLSAHIEEALANNIDVQVALQQITAAQAYYNQAKAGYLPTLSANVQALHQEPSENGSLGAIGAINQYELSANLSWEADIWGKIRSTEKAYQAAYLQTVAAQQAIKSELVANIAAMYYQLLALDEQRRITLQTIANREQSLETTRALKEAGNLTAVAVKQTEAQLYRARAVLIDIQNQIHITENTFSILLGDFPHHIERTDLAEQKLSTEFSAGVPAELLANRPDVIAAEYALVEAFEFTNVARSNFYPSLRLTASGGLQSLELEDWLSVNSLFASVVGSLAQPIFNQRQIRTGYEVAQAQEEIAFLNFRRALLVAAKEVSDALYNMEAAEEKIAVKTEEYEAYELATSYSEELLNNGFANYLEVLTARENALSAQLELINARFQKLEAMVNLYQALGGGWE